MIKVNFDNLKKTLQNIKERNQLADVPSKILSKNKVSSTNQTDKKNLF
jgi:hypothetical protein